MTVVDLPPAAPDSGRSADIAPACRVGGSTTVWGSTSTVATARGLLRSWYTADWACGPYGETTGRNAMLPGILPGRWWTLASNAALATTDGLERLRARCRRPRLRTLGPITAADRSQRASWWTAVDSSGGVPGVRMPHHPADRPPPRPSA